MKKLRLIAPWYCSRSLLWRADALRTTPIRYRLRYRSGYPQMS
jgi:hypothetical protein